MEDAESPLLRLLHDILPDSTLRTIYTSILSPSSPVHLLRRHVLSATTATFDTILPFLRPLADRATQFLYTSPDIVVLIALVLTFLLFLQILSWARRLLAWMVRIAFRLAFWAVIVGIVAVVVRRGPEASVRDAVDWTGRLIGWIGVLREFWVKEYGRYEEQQRRAAGAGGGGYAGGGGRSGRAW